MGIECSMADLERTWGFNNHYPVISTLSADAVMNKFKRYNYISLGKILSSALLKYKKVDRKNYVISELEKIFHNISSKNLIIDDIDMLFNPEYSIDILGYFIKTGRNRRLIILWPGEYVSGSLTYASPEYEDYRKYIVKDYNIILLK